MPTPETQLKSNVKEYLSIMNIFHYPILQGLGAYKGLPDMAIHRNGHVEYLEIKTPKGKLSVYQEMFQGQCHVDGIPYHVIRGLDDIMLVIGVGNKNVPEAYEHSHND